MAVVHLKMCGIPRNILNFIDVGEHSKLIQDTEEEHN